jgi:hypothetical protein
VSTESLARHAIGHPYVRIELSGSNDADGRETSGVLSRSFERLHFSAHRVFENLRLESRNGEFGAQSCFELESFRVRRAADPQRHSRCGRVSE